MCRDIGCPHPRYLEQHGVELEDLNDWHAFYLWENDPGDKEATDEDKADTLKYLQQQWDHPQAAGE